MSWIVLAVVVIAFGVIVRLVPPDTGWTGRSFREDDE